VQTFKADLILNCSGSFIKNCSFTEKVEAFSEKKPNVKVNTKNVGKNCDILKGLGKSYFTKDCVRQGCYCDLCRCERA